MTETEVLSAEMSNEPGALSALCSRLNQERISIKYAYVTSGAMGGKTTGIFKVNDSRKALTLKSKGKKGGRKEKKVVRKPRGTSMR
jgi:hypothetical protein